MTKASSCWGVKREDCLGIVVPDVAVSIDVALCHHQMLTLSIPSLSAKAHA